MHRPAILAAGTVLAACTLPINGLTARDAGGPTTDAMSVPDTGVGVADAGEPDAGPPPPDGGGCGPDRTACDGETLVACIAGFESITDCTLTDQYCDASGGGFACIDRVCAPDTVRCSPDGNSSLLCDARGATESGTLCELGCDGATGACAEPVPCPFADVTDLNEGTQTYDLCGFGADHDNAGLTCGASSLEDRVFRLTLTTRQTFRLEHEDASAPRFIDTSLYIRTVCDEPASEIVCEDNSPSTRAARIQTTLDPGIYYVFADARSTGDCGTVRTRLTFL